MLSSHFKQTEKDNKMSPIAKTTNKMVPPSNKVSKGLQNEQGKGVGFKDDFK